MTETIQTLYGPMTLPDWPDDLICRSLRQCGEWAEAEAEVLAPMLRPGETLWDVGAYLGTFSLGLARLSQPGRIVAVDANPLLQQELTENLTRNAPCPVTVLHSGVGAQQGWIRPVAAAAEPGAAAGAQMAPGERGNHGANAWRQAPAGEGADAVPCRRLMDLRREHGDYDFLKLDIEGMEEAALLGDAVWLRENRPVIWAECNEDIASQKCWSLMCQLGYQVLYIAFPAFRRTTFTGAPPLYPIAYEAGLLAAPEQRLAQLTAQAGLNVSGEDIICRPVATVMDLRMALFDTPRWGKGEWAGLSRPELLARLGRAIRGQRPGDFM